MRAPVPHARKWIASALALLLLAALIPMVGASSSAAATVTWQTINTNNPSNSISSSRVVIRPSDGKAFTAWPASGVLKVATLDHGASVWSAATNAAPSGAATAALPFLSAAPDGRVLIGYASASGAVKTAISNTAGTSWAQSTPATNGLLSLTQVVGSVFNTQDNKFYVSWKTAAGGIGISRSADGANWEALTSPYIAGTTTGGFGPTLAVSPTNGRMVLAWPAPNGVAMSAVAPPNGQFHLVGNITAAMFASTSPQVAAMPDGTIVAAWRASDKSIQTAAMAPNSEAWTALSPVGGAPGVNYSPSLSMNTVSGYMTVAARNASNAVEAFSLRPGETTWTSMGLAATTNADGSQGISNDPIDGSALVVWTDTSGVVKSSRSRTPPGPPSPSSTPTMTARTSTTEQIEWTAAQDGGAAITTYKLELALDRNGPWTANPPGCASLGVVLTCNATGLTPATDYYYRVRATNSAGDGDYSNIGGPFRTLGQPDVSTLAQTNLTATGARLNSSVRPNGVATTAAFTYGTTSNLSGTTTTTAVTLTPNDSDAAQTPYLDVSGLSPTTTYYYRIAATNTYGSQVGTIRSFTTPAGMPLATTEAASGTSSSGATLNGTVNARGADAAVSFTYGLSSNLSSGNSTVSATQSPATGVASTSVSRALTGLAPATTYYYRVSATNAVGGPVDGSILSFTTAAGQTAAITNDPTSLSSTGAVLNGVVDPQGATASIQFKYGTDAGLAGGTTVAGSPASAVSNSQASTYTLSGLLPGTTYYYRVIGTPGEGEAVPGSIKSFQTNPAAPTVNNSPATVVTGSSATLNGDVNANGAQANAQFEYNTSATLAGTVTTVSASESPVNGTGATAISAAISGLLPGTTYYYRALADNGIGGVTRAATISQFTTPTVTGSVTTSAASNVTTTSATFNGLFNPGGQIGKPVGFYYADNPGMTGSAVEIAAQSPMSGSTNQTISANVTGLTPGQTYYFQAAAASDYVEGGIIVGAVVRVDIPAVAPTATTGVASAVTGSSALVAGLVNPGGASTAVTFKYGTSATLAGGTSTINAQTTPISGASETAVAGTLSALASGTTYYYQVIASNGVGAPVAGSIESFTTLGVPGVPQTPSVTPGDGVADIQWTAPTSDGGSPITGYTVTASDGRTCSVVAPFSSPLTCQMTGLPNGTAVTFSISATNAVGTGQAASAGSAVTPSGRPTAATRSVATWTSTSATLPGDVIGNGVSTATSFTYGTQSDLGTGSTTTDATPTGVTSLGGTPISLAITGLSPGTTYYYRANATNANGTSNGTILSFMTDITAPTATTNAATSVTGSAATLNGRVSANGAPTTVSCSLSTSSDMTGATPVVATPASLASNATQDISCALTGLLPGTTYYFRVNAANGTGSPAVGSTRSFTTSVLAPTATTTAAESVSGVSALLKGIVNARGANTTATFTYSLSPTLASGNQTVAATPTPIVGTSDTIVSKTVSGLLLDTTYYYRVSATNSAGSTTSGVIESFHTLNVPSAPLAVTVTPADTQANVTWNIPNSDGGSPVTGYTATAAAGKTCTTGATPPATPATSCVITGLTNGANYTITVRAANAVGTGAPGTASSATTPAGVPIVTTNGPTLVSSTSATLNGTTFANGAVASTSFDYGTDPSMSVSTNVGATPATVASTASGSFSKAVSTSPGTTYYYRACATNSAGPRSCGSILNFTTPAALPTVTTDAAVSITATGAQIRGTVNPNGLVTTPTFAFSTNSSIPAGSATVGSTPTTVSGASSAAVSQTLSGLLPATTYYYRALASNGLGNATPGAIMSFTTSAAPPVPVTAAATSVLGTSATLRGSVNAGGATTDVTFEWGTDSNLAGAAVVTGSPATVSGTSTSAVSYALSGLMTGTTYYYRVRGRNSASVTPVNASNILSFTTQGAPTAPRNVTPTRGDTSVQVQWEVPLSDGGSPITGYTVTATGGGTCTLVSPFSNPLACTISGLSNGTSYTFTVTATNAAGTSPGASSSTVVPAGAPVVATDAVSGVTSAAAIFNGTVNANGDDAAVTFEYGTSPTLASPTTVAASPATATGAADTSVSYAVSGLSPGTTYYYRVLADNAIGAPVAGQIVSFTTNPVAPVVTTNAATSITSNTAVVNGSVVPGGESTGVNFVYWITATPGSPTTVPAAESPVNGLSSVPVSVSLSSLTPGTQYSFRVEASNSAGNAQGITLSFFTPGPPVPTTVAATSVLGTTATLQGTVDASGAAAATSFEWGTSPTLAGASVVTGSPASVSGTSAAAVTYNLSGLTAGTTYYYRMRASNSVSVTPVNATSILSFTTQGVPGAPLNVAALRQDGGAAVSWTTPTSDGGSPITSYTVTESTTGSSCTLVSPFPNPLACVVPGLTNGTGYTFTVRAVNAWGTGPGATTSSVTPAGLPVAVTGGATTASTNATLAGSVVANGASSVTTFVYGLDPTLSSGTQSATATQSPISGIAPVAASATVTGLTPGQTYYYRIRAVNGVGSDDGAIASFTAPAKAPIVTTGNAVTSTATVVRLDGTARAGGVTTDVNFEVGTSANLSTILQRIPAETAPISGDAVETVEANAGALTPATTYYYRVVANNTVGSVAGAIRSFTTTGPPVAVTNTPTAVTTTSANLNALVTANNLDTSVDLILGTDANLSAGNEQTIDPTPSDVTGSTATPVAAAVGSLTPDTTYYYRVVASNFDSGAQGVIRSFRTLALPRATTLNATLGATSATLRGSVNAGGASATVTFRYSLNSDLSGGTNVSASQSPVSGSTNTAVSKLVSGLVAGSRYYFRVSINNGPNTATGSILSFDVPAPTPPTATTTTAIVDGASATLRGTVDANGTPVVVTFRYAKTPDLTGGKTATADQSPVAGSNATQVSKAISGLAAGTTYYYRVTAQNSIATVDGAVNSFVVPQAATATTKPASVGDENVVLKGVIDANGVSATPSFRYSLTADLTGGTNVNATPSPVNGTSPTAVTAQIGDLQPGATYYYRVTSKNAVSTVNGDILSFVAPKEKVKVGIEFVNVPPQMLIGELTRINMRVTTSVTSDSLGTRSNKAAPISTSGAGANGHAKLIINNAYKCTATITDGVGSCLARINSPGVLNLAAKFTGTVDGITGKATASTTARASAGLIAIQAASMRSNGCGVNVEVRGMTTAAYRPVTLYMYLPAAKRWSPIAYAQSSSNRAWTALFRTPSLSLTVMAATPGGTSAPMQLTYSRNRSSDSPMTPRGC